MQELDVAGILKGKILNFPRICPAILLLSSTELQSACTFALLREKQTCFEDLMHRAGSHEKVFMPSSAGSSELVQMFVPAYADRSAVPRCSVNHFKN